MTSNMLGSREREILLSLARSTVVSAARKMPGGGSAPPSPLSPSLSEKSGAFVTLQKSGALRGCIGTLVAEKPLWEAVRNSAWSAAREDHRFPPVVPEEVDDITIEVSVLSPLTEIPSVQEFITGRHGIVLEKNGRRGVFLPKVAAETGWTREQTLSALCKKAGLPVNAWQIPGMRFWIFTVESFSDARYDDT